MFHFIHEFLALYYPAIIAYILGGALYAVLKWTFMLLKLRHKVESITDKDPTAQRRQYAADIFGSYNYPPQVSDCKGLLFTWATFWPINLLWTMFADVAREAWQFLYNKFGAMLQSIARAILPS